MGGQPTHAPVPQRRRTATTNDRIAGVLLGAIGLLGVLWLRCVWLQVVDFQGLAQKAAAQYRATETLRAPRGTIMDRHGRPLAMSVAVPSVYANARQVTTKRELAQQLAGLVDGDSKRIHRQLQRDKGFVWVARQVNPDLTPKLLELRDSGVGTVEELKRVYPHGGLAGHVLGFVNIDHRGLEGLELAFNGMLQGQDGWRGTLRDAKGDLLIGPWTSQADPEPGHDMVLTLDAVVQQVAEEALDWGVKKYRAKGGSVVVMDPYTGALWAVANSPTYDPNDPANAPSDARRNRAVTDLFEPGSIFKIVAASALLEEHRIPPDEVIFCEEGSFHTIGRHVLHDHRPHGALSFHDVIRLSSNIGTSKAAQRLTPDELYAYIRAFGFGQKTGVDLPGEISGMIAPPSRWSGLSPFIIPIGQEVATTPMQLAVMTAVVANGGSRVRPHIVERIVSPSGDTVWAPDLPAPVRILSPETISPLQAMLRDVVESGTGQLAKIQGLTVAGKTGTAQKLEPNGRYSHSRYIASFVGFGPVPDSRFVIVVSVDEPRPTYFGGVVAAPIFKRIVEQLAGYWELDRPSPSPVMAQLP